MVSMGGISGQQLHGRPDIYSALRHEPGRPHSLCSLTQSQEQALGVRHHRKHCSRLTAGGECLTEAKVRIKEK